MSRQICLAQQAKSNGEDDQARTFIFLERALILLPAHDEIWKMLQAAGEKHLVIDEKYPEEGFSATITGTDVLSRPDVDRVIVQAREVALAAEQHSQVSILSKELDGCFEEQFEWLRLRSVLAQARRSKKRTKCVLLLF